MHGCFICIICNQRGVSTTVYPTVYGLKRHVFHAHLYEKGFRLICGINGCPIQLQNQRYLSLHVSSQHPGCEWIPFPNTETESTSQSDGAEKTLDETVNPTTANETVNPTTANETVNPLAGDETVNPATADEIVNPTTANETVNPSAVDETVNQATADETVNPATADETVNPGAATNLCNQEYVEDEDIQTFRNSYNLSNEERQINMALSLAQLKANYSLTNVALGAIQRWCEGMLATLASTLAGGVKLLTSKQTCEAAACMELEDIFELGEGMANPFSGVDTEWNLQKTLKEKLFYVEPETVVLYEVLGGAGQHKEVHSMQYVPVLKVLNLLFKDQRFRCEALRVRPSSEDSMLDFQDGEYYKRHPLFSTNRHALQLQFYYDGFEVVNPLGSKIGKHNLGAIYFSILNVDPSYRSTLKSICLTALVYESDIKHPEIGWEVILQRLNSELKELEQGVYFEIDKEMVFIQGTIAQFALDNKAAHSLFGFHECFYGQDICISRYCYCTTADIQTKVMSEECQLRDRVTYADDLADLERTGVTTHGIKSKCFLESRFFHPAEAFAADIHHDVLEGLIPGMLKPILQALVRLRYVDVELLNARIASFDYNFHDVTNKPSQIKEAKFKDDSRSLKQYAAQYWCLLRKLPLLIGDRIPDNDEHWCLLLQMVNVVDLIMSPKVDEAMLAYLKMQQLTLFTEFKRLFPFVSITPKMHYTLHYSRLMKEVGPLIRHWVMRYEAKHHFFKRAAIVGGNFINVARSLALRHQMLQVVHVHGGGFISKEVSVTSGIQTPVDKLPCNDDIQQLLRSTTVTLCEKITINGTSYRKGNAILIGFEDNGFPQIGEVESIAVNAKLDVCFTVSSLRVLEFCEHFNSWRIEKPKDKELKIAMYSSLPDHHPVGLHSPFNAGDSLFANFRYHIKFEEG